MFTKERHRDWLMISFPYLIISEFLKLILLNLRPTELKFGHPDGIRNHSNR